MDRVTQYAKDVLEDKIIAGNSVKLACKRHLNDIRRSKNSEFKYCFDIDRANKIIDFAETLILIEGVKERPLKLYPWQSFILGSLLGWVHKDTGIRRYRESYVQVGRQQGKSLLSGILTTYFGNFIDYKRGLILLFAVDLKQAKIVFKEAVKFIESDNDLEELFNIKDYKSEIECNLTNNLIRAISKNPKAMDGFRCVFASADELHNHKNGDLYNLVKDGQADLEECLLNTITTAGFNIDGFCHRKYKYCKDILNKIVTNEEYFVYIAELDEDDDLSDINNWYKTKPCLEYDPTGKKIKVLQNSFDEAQKIGGKQWNNFLTKHLNMWVEFSETKYMNMTAWHKCGTNKTLEDFRGQDFILGMDLSSGGDLTSVTFEFTWFEEDEKKYFVHHHSFIPKMRIQEHEQTDNAPYRQWIKDGLLTITTASGGIKTDYREVFRYIKETIKQYDLKLQMICYDQHNASAFLADLDEFGVDCIDIYQNSKSLNDPVMDIRYSVEAENVEYNKNDELLTWAMNNCELTKPRNGYVMLDKNSRFDRIDPVASWVDAHKFSMRNEKPKVDINEAINDEWTL